MHKSGFVYVLKTPFGMKIGKTINIDARLKAIGKDYEVSFVHAIIAHDIHQLERALHLRFVDKRVMDAPSREIFALSLQDVQWIQSIQHFKGRECKHIESLTDAVRHSIAMARRFYVSTYE